MGEKYPKIPHFCVHNIRAYTDKKTFSICINNKICTYHHLEIKSDDIYFIFYSIYFSGAFENENTTHIGNNLFYFIKVPWSTKLLLYWNILCLNKRNGSPRKPSQIYLRYCRRSTWGQRIMSQTLCSSGTFYLQ